MGYERLQKVFYKETKEKYNHELTKRKESYGSYSTDLIIRGFRRGEVTSEFYPLFYVNTHQLAQLNNQVLLNSATITKLVTQLPDFAVEPYFYKLSINEAQSNNEIEGVRSTKKELKEVLDEVITEKSVGGKKRFAGMMNMYVNIDKMEPFLNISDFRKLYDEFVSEEVATDDQPDGLWFRTGYVEVGNGSKTTHVGVSSEEKIIEALNALIRFLGDDGHLELYRYMLAHYYYEYIHPFYDGNGRTGRVFVCSYLARYLERYSALTFSYAVNKHKNQYYKALEEMPVPQNQGEATFYLMDMLELLVSGQKEVIDDLEISLSKLEQIKQFFDSGEFDMLEGFKYSQETILLLKNMTIITIFVDGDADFTIEKLMHLSGQSKYIVNKMMDELEKVDVVYLITRKPKRYVVREELLEVLELR